MKNTHLPEESKNSIPGVYRGSILRIPALSSQPNKLAEKINDNLLSEESDYNTIHRNNPAVHRISWSSGKSKKKETDHQELDLDQKPVISGRERLKRHREEVAGKVSIPENWGKEGLLKDWVDFSAFDDALTSKKIFSARSALMADAVGSVPRQRLRVETTC